MHVHDREGGRVREGEGGRREEGRREGGQEGRRDGGRGDTEGCIMIKNVRLKCMIVRT